MPLLISSSAPSNIVSNSYYCTNILIVVVYLRSSDKARSIKIPLFYYVRYSLSNSSLFRFVSDVLRSPMYLRPKFLRKGSQNCILCRDLLAIRFSQFLTSYLNQEIPSGCGRYIPSKIFRFVPSRCEPLLDIWLQLFLLVSPCFVLENFLTIAVN